MNSCNDEKVNRSVLLGAKIRFSPSGATVRNQAIERIIEQNLASVNATKGLTEQELQKMVTLGGQLTVLRASDVRDGLDSLRRSNRILEVVDGRKKFFTLSEDVKNEVIHIITEAEEHTKATINELFKNASGGEEAYRKPFLRLLCMVFSKLSDVYVQVITMEQTEKEFTEHRLLAAAVDEVLKQESIPDQDAFHYGISRFFKESTPLFDQIKWNMAQNFYVAKALGIDSSADLLSADTFKDASLYCDTNVLIAGLMPENRHHSSILELAHACKSIGMSIKAARVTVDELKQVIAYHASMFQKVKDQIPENTCHKVRDFLLEAYLSEKETAPDLSFDEFIDHFQVPIQTLQASFDLEEVDDKWFLEAFHKPTSKKLAKELIKQYFEIRKRHKSEKAALHDAVLLLWVSHENEENRKSWLVTLDLTLSEWNAGQNTHESKVITLDAFLQWMTPILSGTADEDKLAQIFAEAIRYQLLPRDTFFQLRDFLVFAEMGIEAKQLPAEDVEACIREIRKTGPSLDPTKAEDREKIGQIIQRYFADPGTKFKQTIHELQAKTEKLSHDLEDESRLRKEAESKVQQLDQFSIEQGRDLLQEKAARESAEARIARLEHEFAEEQKKAHHRAIVNSAILTTTLMIAFLLITEFFAIMLIQYYGDGNNFFQKITNSWSWLAFIFSFCTIIYPFLMGRECMRLLKWWKGEDE